MKPFNIFAAFSIVILLTGLSACQKSEKVEVKTTETVSTVEKTAPVIKAAPAISPGTWTGTIPNRDEATLLTIEPGDRMTIAQHDTPSAGHYSIDSTQTPAVLSFTPDENPSTVYTSQIQWIDDSTITMTSFVESPVSPASQAPAAPPASTPFTGSVPPPPVPVHSNPEPVAAGDSVFAPAIFTVTFKKQ